jgi:hypothetical protein
MTTITYKVPVALKGKIGFEERTGTVAVMQIGPRRIRCAIQENGALAHVASGNLIVNANRISAVHVGNLMGRGSYAPKLSARRAAEIALANIINQVGHEKVLAVIDAAPVINA